MFDKKEFQKVIATIRNEGNSGFPKAMMTRQQMVKGTATVNCGGEWRTKEYTETLSAAIMKDTRFQSLIEKYNATAEVELNTFGTYQIRINY